MTAFTRTNDDFLAPIVDTTTNIVHSDQHWTSGGSSPTDPITADNSDSHGWLRLATDGVAFRTSWLALGSSSSGALVDAGTVRRVKWRFKTNSASDVFIRLGIGNDITSSSLGTESVYIEYIGSDIRLVTVAGGVGTVTSTSTGIVTTPTSYELVRASSTKWQLFVVFSDGIRRLLATNTTNTPADSSVMTAGARLFNNAAAVKHLDLDLFEMVSGGSFR